MKKLLILTVLLSAANLNAATTEEAHSILSAAQQERLTALKTAKEHEAAIKAAYNRAKIEPGAQTYQALQAAIARHGETVDHCSRCVEGIQSSLKRINAAHHFVHGDAFTGSVHNVAAASPA